LLPQGPTGRLSRHPRAPRTRNESGTPRAEQTLKQTAHRVSDARGWLTDQNAQPRKTGMQGGRRNNLLKFTGQPHRGMRNLHLGQNRNPVSRGELANSSVRRYRRVPIGESEVRQIHLRQNENDGK